MFPKAKDWALNLTAVQVNLNSKLKLKWKDQMHCHLLYSYSECLFFLVFHEAFGFQSFHYQAASYLKLAKSSQMRHICVEWCCCWCVATQSRCKFDLSGYYQSRMTSLLFDFHRAVKYLESATSWNTFFFKTRNNNSNKNIDEIDNEICLKICSSMQINYFPQKSKKHFKPNCSSQHSWISLIKKKQKNNISFDRLILNFPDNITLILISVSLQWQPAAATTAINCRGLLVLKQDWCSV